MNDFEINQLLRPAIVDHISTRLMEQADTFGANLSDEDCDLAVVSLHTAMYASNDTKEGIMSAPSLIRKYLYSLSFKFGSLNIRDYGEFIPENDDEKGLSEAVKVLQSLVKKGKKVLLIGGSNYSMLIASLAMSLSEKSFSSAIVKPSYILHSDKDKEYIPSLEDKLKIVDNIDSVDILATQNYLQGESSEYNIVDTKFHAHRLAKVQDYISEYEPLLRDSGVICLSAAAIRGGDCPASSYASPNGLRGEEACYLSRLSGMSERCKIFVLTDFIGTGIGSEVSCSLAAQIAWHYIEGVTHCPQDYPNTDLSFYQKHSVVDTPTGEQVNFYNNCVNDRWWIEIPRKDGEKKIHACSRSDYETMKKRLIPDIWYRYYHN